MSNTNESPFAWRDMKDAPKDRAILATIQESNGVAVRVVYHQPYGNRNWRSLTGQRIAPGCVLAWMEMPGGLNLSLGTH